MRRANLVVEERRVSYLNEKEGKEKRERERGGETNKERSGD